MSDAFRVDGHDVWLEGPHFGRQPGWTRWKVHVDDVHAGWLDRHTIAPDVVEWLIASPRWDSVAAHDYVSRDEAIDALVRHHLMGEQQ